MAWTYEQLKAAVLALSPAPADTAAAAAAINAQTTTAIRDIPVSEIEAVVVPSMELFWIDQMSAKPTSGSVPPSTADQVIAGSWSFSQMLTRWATIQTSDSAIWASCQGVMSGLQSIGLLSENSVNAITALRTAVVPAWQPTVTEGDVQTAQAQP